MSKRLVWMVSATAAFGCATAPVQRPLPSSDIAADVAFIASPALRGRATGSAGADAASRFIAQRYIELRVNGAFPSMCDPASECRSGYFQVFELNGLGAKNVLAAIPGADPLLRGRIVVVGAHFDHVGTSSGPSSRQPTPGVRPGADDNASGTAATLELARRLAADPPPASVLLAHFDAEEHGLVGSREFLEATSIPLDSVSLMINLDMIGRLRGEPLRVEVTSPADGVEPLLDSLSAALAIELRYSISTAGRSDHASFSERGVPAIALFTGFHSDYHRTTDTPDKIDYDGMERIVEFVEALVRAAGARR